MDRTLLLWGYTQVGKTTLLSTGLLSKPEDFPAVNWAASHGSLASTIKEHYGRLRTNRSVSATSDDKVDVHLVFNTGQKLAIRDIRGGLTLKTGVTEIRQLVDEAQGVLFVVEWEGQDIGRHMDAIDLISHVCADKKLKIGLAITKCERGLQHDDPAWRLPADWWRNQKCWEPHERILERFGPAVWPTSAYGHDAEGRPACILGEFGQLLPYNVEPVNVREPFRWFFKELGLC